MDRNEKQPTSAEVASDSGNGSGSDITDSAGFDQKATKKLLRRLDWHIIPFMSLIYLQATPS